MKFEKLINALCSGKPQLAVLIDPDKYNPLLPSYADDCGVSCFLAGGSALKENNISAIVKSIKKNSSVPVILFPGDETQLTPHADGLLLLSLLSGRNPEYLIEKHVRAAPIIRKMKLPFLPTAYLLIDGGRKSSTQKVTRTKPLDASDIGYIKNTCIAGEQLGFKAIYLEAGSGAKNNVPAKIIKEIRRSISVPLIVGGGVDSRESAERLIEAGANMIVVGNALERNMNRLKNICKAF